MLSPRCEGCFNRCGAGGRTQAYLSGGARGTMSHVSVGDDDEGAAGSSDASIQHTCAHGDMACDLLQSTRHKKLRVEDGPAGGGVLTIMVGTIVTRDKERAGGPPASYCPTFVPCVVAPGHLEGRLSTAPHRTQRHVVGENLRC